ncbi:MAG TPA: hypothetical protein VFC31_14685 [Candidatus Limnocylindria bacterium]|nr:hypothetical protein [Candidatus Limnocylindria bacterium]
MNSPTTTLELVTHLKEDRPGELAKAVTAIANMDINIEGFCEVNGELHVVAGDPENARKALETVGFDVDQREIFILEAEDRPGFLANVLRRLSAEELNVIASYSLTKTRIAFTVDQPARVKDILRELSPTTRVR